MNKVAKIEECFDNWDKQFKENKRLVRVFIKKIRPEHPLIATLLQECEIAFYTEHLQFPLLKIEISRQKPAFCKKLKSREISRKLLLIAREIFGKNVCVQRTFC